MSFLIFLIPLVCLRNCRNLTLRTEAIFEAVLKIKEKTEKGENVSLLEELKRQLLQQEKK